MNYKSSLFTKLLYRKLLVCGKYTADDTTQTNSLCYYNTKTPATKSFMEKKTTDEPL